MTTIDASPEAVAEMIGSACARQVKAELHHEPGTGLVSVGRTRLLRQKGNLIIADKPMYTGDDQPILAGQPITVHYSIQRTRFQFQSVLEDTRYRVRIDAGRWGMGCAFRRPDSVRRSQRRRHLRMSMAGCDPITVEAVRPDPTVSTACAVDAERTCGRLVDLSCGGAAVLFDRAAWGGCRSGERFYLRFVIPGEPAEFSMLGLVRHTRLIASSESMRIGFGFRPWYRGQLIHDQRRLARFIATLERQSLRRRK